MNVKIMKYLITENQRDELIKRVVGRREREIKDMMWEMLHTDVGEEASDYPSDDFVNYVSELIMDELFTSENFNDWDMYSFYEYEVKKLIEDDVLEYWENHN